MPDTNPLNKLASLLWNEHFQYWSARARHCNVYVHDADPEQAIMKAIEARDAEQLAKQSEASDQESLRFSQGPLHVDGNPT